MDSVAFSVRLPKKLSFGLKVYTLAGFHYHTLAFSLWCLGWVLEGSGTRSGSDALPHSPGDIPGLKHTVSQNSKVYALRGCDVTRRTHTLPFAKVSMLFLRSKENLNILVESAW